MSQPFFAPLIGTITPFTKRLLINANQEDPCERTIHTLVMHRTAKMKAVSSNYNLNVEVSGSQREATIHFSLSETSDVLLHVMSADDREVRLLVNETMPGGHHSALFAFGNLLPDDYVIRLLINSRDAVDIETLNFKIQ